MYTLAPISARSSAARIPAIPAPIITTGLLAASAITEFTPRVVLSMARLQDKMFPLCEEIGDYNVWEHQHRIRAKVRVFYGQKV